VIPHYKYWQEFREIGTTCH